MLYNTETGTQITHWIPGLFEEFCLFVLYIKPFSDKWLRWLIMTCFIHIVYPIGSG